MSSSHSSLELSCVEGLGKNERTEGQKFFHTVGGLADPANVQLHIGNQCPLLHYGRDSLRH